MDTKQFIAEHLNDDVSELALRYGNAKVDMTLALRQIAARQMLQKKVPSWSSNENLLFPPHLSIEQCSSEATALYKASLLQGKSFVDLTGGLGVDCHFIAQNFEHADYVELNPELCELAAHNFKVLSEMDTSLQAKRNNPSIHNESAESYLKYCKPVDCIFLDPARRDQYGRKTVAIADCTPNVIELQDLLLQKALRVMVKLSPMLDISKALKELRCVKEVHVVAVANECKELLFLLESGFEGEPTFICVNLQTSQPVVKFKVGEERHCEEERRSNLFLQGNEIQKYLYEPNAALMKAGCFQILSQRFDIRQLHPNSHLYTSEQLVSNYPGRKFEVIGWASYNKRIKQTLLADVTKANITTRNFPLSVAELRKVLKINDGDQIYLFATTIGNNEKIIIKTLQC